METTEFDPAPIDRIHGIGGADLVNKMAEIFFKNGPDRTATALEGLAAKDFEVIERAVHSLKSSAGNMGALDLQSLCQEIEDLAEAETLDGIEDRLGRLSETYQKAEVSVRHRLQELAS